MSPRADDDTPRRGNSPRRGSSRDVSAEEPEENPGRRGRSSIADARAYTPRGRSVAERGRLPRSDRTGGDPFRPALQVLDGGETGQRSRGRGRAADNPDQPGTTPAARRPDRDGAAGTRDGAARSREGAARSRDGAARTRDGAKDGAAARKSAPRDGEGRESTGRTRETAGRRDTAPGRSRPTGTEPGRNTSDRSRAADARTGKAGRSGREGRAGNESWTGRGGREAPRRNAGGRPERKAAPRARLQRVHSEPPKLANSASRLRLGTVLALSLFVMIAVRLVVLQVATSPAEAQSLMELRDRRLSTVELPAPRGSILDRNGNVLAHSVEARYVYADPENAELQKDVPGVAAKLAPLLHVSQSALIENMQREQLLGRWLKFRYLARGVDVAVADRIKELRLPGIFTHSDERRDVPGKDLAANLIGFTGDDGLRGLEGLEARYDDLLHGIDGKRVFEVGKGDLSAPIPGGYERHTDAKPGNSLQLTIDRDLQYRVQQILDSAAEKKKATVAGAVVMDARTGEVLAQASYPTYNAAKPEASDAEDRIDVPTSVVTDPGSSHKAFIFGAALEEGLIEPDSTLVIGPAVERGGYTFDDGHPMPAGTEMTMPGLLALSSNVGTILIGERLGKEKIYEYQKLFGLGTATGVGMPGEADGELLPPDKWSGSAYGSVPIGHSVSATLMQMVAAYGAIANDGTYLQPHLIKSTIAGTDKKVTPGPAPRTHKVLSPETASQLRTMMEAVVESKEGTGGAASVPGYRVAGKTGTGKMLIDGQYTSHNAGSFIGMAPAEDPRYVIGVSMDVAIGTGGDVAAPAFGEMMAYTLRHNAVPPSGTKIPTFKIHP